MRARPLGSPMRSLHMGIAYAFSAYGDARTTQRRRNQPAVARAHAARKQREMLEYQWFSSHFGDNPVKTFVIPTFSLAVHCGRARNCWNPHVFLHIAGGWHLAPMRF